MPFIQRSEVSAVGVWGGGGCGSRSWQSISVWVGQERKQGERQWGGLLGDYCRSPEMHAGAPCGTSTLNPSTVAGYSTE
jgi:hypothetical protein